MKNLYTFHLRISTKGNLHETIKRPESCSIQAFFMIIYVVTFDLMQEWHHRQCFFLP